ncbi:hypothetical protein K435DRAFT_961694 [Dendrothele bispora CBS 962.96]|uniref:Uncharacterized protein n=1 Tax=Dendrothele bispora (strain CBS 962.96) TaxID=1314807 RepID=A0A4S8MQB9_DENBC|nr:hypothetical protein K435DRAFT_961694 [Dendrothele bispora CBS 962.96]
MQLKTVLFFLSAMSLTTAAAIQERQSCTSIFVACTLGSNECCSGLSCLGSNNSPVGNCLPTPGVCGALEDQCSTAFPNNTCCPDLFCSGLIGVCE